ncbi:TspO/MBR family protein [Clostridium rectalis]|uniref:TspO/MBR family protein n=1 Tax=Clostridium rectalis TaxID=2040295 RepID=UPI001FA994C5|nr:TspO/MBR family protein [Clostridium rectalis]
MKRIKKPTFMPPQWIFAPVWSILYTLIAISAVRILCLGKKGKRIKKAMIFFSVQLVLNILWPYIFFRLKLKGLSFAELLTLLVFIILTTVEFIKIDKVSAYLLIPYLFWSTFAAYLNGSIWYMNK